MAYVAVRRLKWGDGWIEPGEAVPEGERGRNYSHLLRLGMIERVEGTQSKSETRPTNRETTGGENGEADQGVACPECGVVVASKFALAGHMRSHKSGE